VQAINSIIGKYNNIRTLYVFVLIRYKITHINSIYIIINYHTNGLSTDDSHCLFFVTVVHYKYFTRSLYFTMADSLWWDLRR